MHFVQRGRSKGVEGSDVRYSRSSARKVGTLPLLCGSVDLHPDLFLTPMKGPLVGVADVGS